MSSKKQMIIQIESMSKSNKLTILQWLIENKVRLSESNDGVRVNLDKIGKRKLARLNKLIKKLPTEIEQKYKI